MWHGVCLSLAKILRSSRKKDFKNFPKKTQKKKKRAKVIRG